MMNFYLEEANFKRHASTFILNSLISIGNIYVGWKYSLIQNPKYVLAKTRELRASEQKAMSKIVANPQSEPTMTAEEMQDSLLAAVNKVMAEAQGVEPEEESKNIPPYIQQGGFDFKDPMDQFFYWDSNVSYMEDSSWKAWEEEVPRYRLEFMAKKLGMFPVSKLDAIPSKRTDDKTRISSKIYSGLDQNRTRDDDMVKLCMYYGPLIVDNRLEKDSYFCIIANEQLILKEGDYPFWEPPGHKTPLVNTAVRQVPNRATGAGIGDNAYGIQRQLDRNWHLVCDSWSLNVAGLNIINTQKVVDKSELQEGIEPGKWIEVRDEPDKVFKHLNMTSNVENQVAPINTVLASAMEEQTGINSLMRGGSNLRSRTTAAETKAISQGSANSVNTIALDLESNFLVPVLQKCLARIMQFVIPDLENNQAVKTILDQEELELLSQLNEADRVEIVNSFYRISINGFSARQVEEADIMRLNELFQIATANPALNSLVDWAEALRIWQKLMRLEKYDMLILKNTETERIMAENTVMAQNTEVNINPNDNHELHLQMQSQPRTQAAAMHAQMHQQALMEIQMLQQQQAQMQQGQGQLPQ
jgi:hypothetical protein